MRGDARPRQGATLSSQTAPTRLTRLTAADSFSFIPLPHNYVVPGIAQDALEGHDFFLIKEREPI